MITTPAPRDDDESYPPTPLENLVDVFGGECKTYAAWTARSDSDDQRYPVRILHIDDIPDPFWACGCPDFRYNCMLSKEGFMNGSETIHDIGECKHIARVRKTKQAKGETPEKNPGLTNRITSAVTRFFG